MLYTAVLNDLVFCVAHTVAVLSLFPTILHVSMCNTDLLLVIAAFTGYIHFIPVHAQQVHFIVLCSMC